MIINFCRSEQLRCAELYHDAGARLGMNDWFCEEFLMEIENHATLPGPDHPAYAVDREDDGDRDDRIYAAWIAEQDGTPTSGGVRITSRRTA